MGPGNSCLVCIGQADFENGCKGLSIQLRVSLNIPDKDVRSDHVEQDDIPTLVRFFNEGNQPELYQPNAFTLAWGSFLTNSDTEDFHILLHASSVDRLVTSIPPQEQT